jgi:hypothetical protein
MLEEADQFDTWQAWSRVKDPEGKENSLVFALGCSVEECENLTSYGFNRKVEIEPYERNQKKRVKVLIEENEISKPLIKKCLSFGEMLKEAFIHKQSKNTSLKSENFLLSKVYRTFSGKRTQILDSREALISRILNRTDIHVLQKSDGRYEKFPVSVSVEMIQKHLNGLLTLGAYQFNLKNEVKWIAFDIDSHAPKNVIETEEEIKRRDDKAENDKERLCSYLESLDIPYLIEKSGSPHSYHIWIFVEPVSGAKASLFALTIAKDSGVDCEVYPKQEEIGKDGFGNLLKIPFALHRKHNTWSQILINGEYVSDISKLEIGVLDISGIEVPEKKNIETTVIKEIYTPKLDNKVPIKKKVRPCIEAAAQQQLTGDAGNFMRVAIVREFYNSGMHEPGKIAVLFSSQKDYSYDKSLYHVRRVLNAKVPHIKCKTLKEKGKTFVNCFKCKYRRSFTQKVEISKNPPESNQSDYSESIT